MDVSPKSDTRVRRQKSTEANKKQVYRYTLVDLVDNINTDVKSEVADFDF